MNLRGVNKYIKSTRLLKNSFKIPSHKNAKFDIKVGAELNGYLKSLFAYLKVSRHRTR
uniref:hypothetical protein n=1 Tax=Vibrio parahaemolyticus TaxID=670 RepID=UPI00063BD29D|nr:hypothetical protein [Vibrio parahaemolyticus]CQB47026.1 hypothetical protein [Vibrio cholerae]